MATIPRKKSVTPKNTFIFTTDQVAAGMQNKENLWENPPEATPAMKQAIQQFKDRFNSNEQWDGDFSL